MLLLHLHRLARRLRPVLPLCFGAACVGIALALFLLLRAEPSTELLSLALGLSVWAILLYAFIQLFQSIPPPVLPKDRWIERAWGRCRLALYHVLAVAVLIIALVLVSMSLKLASAIAG